MYKKLLISRGIIVTIIECNLIFGKNDGHLLVVFNICINIYLIYVFNIFIYVFYAHFHICQVLTNYKFVHFYSLFVTH